MQRLPRAAHEQDLPEQTTDDSGEATFDLSMANLEPSAYRLSFLAEGFEKEGGRSVTAGSEVGLAAGVAGRRQAGWRFQLCASGHATHRAIPGGRSATQADPGGALETEAQRELRYVSVLVQKPNGNYAYESMLKEIPVSEDERVDSGDRDLTWPLAIRRSRVTFAARLYDDHGDLVADVRYSVAGAGNISVAGEECGADRETLEAGVSAGRGDRS